MKVARLANERAAAEEAAAARAKAEDEAGAKTNQPPLSQHSYSKFSPPNEQTYSTHFNPFQNDPFPTNKKSNKNESKVNVSNTGIGAVVAIGIIGGLVAILANQ